MGREYGISNAVPYASAPAVGAAGDTYFNTTDKLLYVSDGAAWSKVAFGLTRVRVARTTTQSIPSGATTMVSFDSVLGTDPSSMWAAGTPDRLTCKAAGFYVFGGGVVIDSSTGGARRVLNVYVNGSAVASTEAPQGNVRGLAVTSAATLALNDTIQVGVFQDSGAALNIGTAPTAVSLWAAQVA